MSDADGVEPRLEWTDEVHQERSMKIHDKVFVGRVCSGVDPVKRILINHPLVSRDHLVFTRTPSGLEILDTSKNGTWLNDVRVTSGASRKVRHGDVVRIGETRLRVFDPAGPSEAEQRLERTVSDEFGTMVEPLEICVTHLVADVRGFTTLSQTKDSAQVYALMKPLFEAFSTVINECQGTVKDYAGDAIYAFWEHPTAPSPDKALLACRAALRQMEVLDRLRNELAARNPAATHLTMGWGITTGMVTLSHYGARIANLAVVGDSTNLAFRLSGVANKDVDAPVVLCSRTARLVGGHLALEDLGEVAVKGRSGAEPVFGLKP